MLSTKRFALNKMLCPNLNLEQFFRLTNELGLRKVELRNDLAGGKVLEDFSPDEAQALADQMGIEIITINAIQHFNLPEAWDRVAGDVDRMIATARAIGCPGIVLCPNNDVEDRRTPQAFYQDTVTALDRLAPVFEESGIAGLVEPLGFEECSLRSKDTAVKAIEAAAGDRFRLVHDTFHHHLGPDENLQVAHTGLVHISGVDADLPPGQMRDPHRVLVDGSDKLRNLEQIKALLDRGYEGDFSFEPFSESVHQMDIGALKSAVAASIAYIADNV